MADRWSLRLRTAEALAYLVATRGVLALLPYAKWSRQVGLVGQPTEADQAEAARLARHIERAASRLPLETKCLPRAVALSRMLRRRALPHRLVIAARPAAHRQGQDDLHAWIEVDQVIAIGQLPGPWARLAAIPDG